MERTTHIWIPEDSTELRDLFAFTDDGGFEVWQIGERFRAYCNDCHQESVFVIADCVFSLKSALDTYAELDLSRFACDITGSREDDQSCTCLKCGSLEEGSAPFHNFVLDRIGDTC